MIVFAGQYEHKQTEIKFSLLKKKVCIPYYCHKGLDQQIATAERRENTKHLRERWGIFCKENKHTLSRQRISLRPARKSVFEMKSAVIGSIQRTFGEGKKNDESLLKNLRARHPSSDFTIKRKLRDCYNPKCFSNVFEKWQIAADSRDYRYSLTKKNFSVFFFLFKLPILILNVRTKDRILEVIVCK